jgi:ribosomal protein L31
MSKNAKLEVGKEVVAYCSKCKDTTTHVIEVIKNDKISRVMCKVCLSSHRFRTDAGEEKAVKKVRKIAKKAPPKTSQEKKWERMLAKTDNGSPIEYKMQNSYKVLNVIQHHTFGVGVVREVYGSTKMAVVFQIGEKVLVQNLL